VQEIASALLAQTSIPAIAAQQELLDEVAVDEWWVDVTPPSHNPRLRKPAEL
jgi:type I restriction enzyme, R subunit